MTIGQLQKDFYVQCGRCQHWQMGLGGNAGRAEDELRRLGWHIRRPYGWICPVCFQAIVPEATEAKTGYFEGLR